MLKANATCSGCADLAEVAGAAAGVFWPPPPTGLLQAFHNWMRPQASGFEKNPLRQMPLPLFLIVTQA